MGPVGRKCGDRGRHAEREYLGGEKYLVDERRRAALGWREEEEYLERGTEIFGKVERGREMFASTETRIPS